MVLESDKLSKNKFFTRGLTSTIVAAVACLSTHIVTIVGLSGAVAWLDTLEHALLFLSIALAGLTIYAAVRHRKHQR